MRTPIVTVALVFVMAVEAQAQTFSSGSTGADGAAYCSNQGTVYWQVPDSGVFNFTTVNVTFCNVRFIPNQRNTPVIMLAQGDVVIANSYVNLDGSAQTPGPGGFFGGAPGQAGFGPGGGAPGQHGQWVGPLSLVPPIGGSGGGGSGSYYGGGGGGSIVIASSTSIQCTPSTFGIIARGGFGGGAGAGRGAGGAIRLVANSITGSCLLNATAAGNDGLIRIEAQPGQLLYTGTATPPAVLSTINPEVVPTSTTASLTITSIGGFPVFTDAGVRPGTVDVVLPRALTDPIAVAVQARNIPLGTEVNLNVTGSSGTTYTPETLAGAFELSTATLQVSGLDRSAETHLFVFATFDVPEGAGPFNPDGPDQVAQLRIQTTPGRPSTMAFLRRDGSEIDSRKVPPALIQYFNATGR